MTDDPERTRNCDLVWDVMRRRYRPRRSKRELTRYDSRDICVILVHPREAARSDENPRLQHASSWAGNCPHYSRGVSIRRTYSCSLPLTQGMMSCSWWLLEMPCCSFLQELVRQLSGCDADSSHHSNEYTQDRPCPLERQRQTVAPDWERLQTAIPRAKDASRSSFPSLDQEAMQAPRYC